MLHVERVLQYSEALCCTWDSSCNIRGCFVARGHRLATFGGAMLHVGLVLQHSGTLIVTSHQTCQQQYSYCHFSPNVSTTTLLLSLLAKRVNNSTLIVTSCQTCQQRYHNNTITTPYLILRSLHHPTFYLVIQYLQIYTLKRTFSFGFANVKVLFLIKFIYSFFVFYFFGILNI